jgi:uncharacterized protein with PIN domain
MRFVADSSLGRLAKWLRLLGFDTVVQALPSTPARLPPPVSGTVYLTRRAAWQGSLREDVLVLKNNDPERQLAELGQRFALHRQSGRAFSRCAECNEPLLPLDRGTALELVPDHVFFTQEQFFQCPACRRVYWPGSHLNRIITKIKEMFPDRGRLLLPPGNFRKGVPYGH